VRCWLQNVSANAVAYPRALTAVRLSHS
jgi:hypothetical protein